MCLALRFVVPHIPVVRRDDCTLAWVIQAVPWGSGALMSYPGLTPQLSNTSSLGPCNKRKVKYIHLHLNKKGLS